MMRKLLLLFLFTAVPAFAQNSPWSGQVLSGSGRPIAGANIAVCAAGAAGVPCSPTVTIYKDTTNGTPLTQPIQTDSFGNFSFYAPPGNYEYTISGTLVGPTSAIPFTVPCAPGTTCAATGANNAFTGNNTFTGALNCKNFENNFCVDSTNSQGWAGSSIDAWITSAIAGCPSGGCNIYVYAPAGTITTWNAKVIINKPVTLIGPGPSVLFQEKNAMNDVLISIQSSNVRVANFYFDGNRANQTSGFGISVQATVNHVDIDHNQLQNFFFNCITANNASYLRIQHNRLSNCYSSGNFYAIDYTMNSTPTNETNVFIDHNDIDQSAASAGGINVATTLATGSIKTLKVDDNNVLVGDAGGTDTLGVQLFSNGLGGFISGATVNNNRIFAANATNTNTWGISVGAAGVTHTNVAVVGNSIRDTRKTCIEAIGQALTVAGNNCYDTGGIQVPTNSGAMQGISVTGNTLVSGSGIFSLGEIGISGASGFGIQGAVVSGNSIYLPANGERCIIFNGNATGQISNSQITGNTCIGNAASTTQPAIELNQTSQSKISENQVINWSGGGSGQFGIAIDQAASTGNRVGPNQFVSVTTPVSDSGTSTQFNEPQVKVTITAPFRATEAISDQGSICTNGELGLSAGWQSTGSATVTNVKGNGQTCEWTITTGTTTAASPTVTDTLTNALPNATTVCEMVITGGNRTPAAGDSFDQTTLSATVPVFTFQGTPTAGGKTYQVVRRCGP